MRRAFRRAVGVEEEPSVNLTPLIDVVFVILIVFIVIAPLLEVDQVELAMGKQTVNQTVSETSPIAVHVKADNSVWLNRQRISIGDLRDRAAALRKAHPGVKPQVFHDKKAHFGTYQQVKNAMEEAGFEQMDIILSPG
jgi:biopolymer transport protein ExbD